MPNKLGDLLKGEVKMASVYKKDENFQYVAMKGMTFNTDIKIEKGDIVKVKKGKKWESLKETKPKPKPKGGK